MRDRLLPWACGALAATALCLGYVLMGVFRGAWQSHYPRQAAEWANNGRFALIGAYGTELAYEELAYAARVVEASRSFPAYDPYIREHRSARQAVVDALTYSVMGLAHRAVGEINRTWILLRFASCLAWFLLIYALVRRSGRSPGLAVFCAAAVSLFSYLMTLLFLHAFAGASWGARLWGLLSYGRTEGVLRLPRPGVSYSFLFLATLWTLNAARTRSWAWATAAGLLAGALAYVRLDVWTGHCLALFVFTVASSVNDRALNRRLAWSCVLAALVSAPYLGALYPADPDLLMRSGLEPSRRFDPWSLGYGMIAAAGLRWARTDLERFCAAMSAGTFVMVNIELVLGHPMMPEHWKFFGNIYIFLLAMLRVPASVERREGAWLAGAAALAGIAFLQGVVYAGLHYPFQGLPKRYDEAIAWLRENSPPDAVVFTVNPEVMALLPVYAHQKVVAGFVLPVVSQFPTIENLRRLVGAGREAGLDMERYFRDSVLSSRPANDRRGVVAAALRRGTIEKPDVYQALLCTTPGDRAPGLVAEALARPRETPFDLAWIGHMEREYGGGRSPFLDATRWREVYRNPEVTIYGRSRGLPKP